MSASVYKISPQIASRSYLSTRNSPYHIDNNSCVNPVSRICRNLFGSEDPIDSSQFVKKELAIELRRATEKWGFDFELDEPIIDHERFQWERVPSDASQVPEFYIEKDTKIYKTTINNRINSQTSSEPNHLTISDLIEKNESLDQVSTLDHHLVPSKQTCIVVDNKQSRITDYMRIRKRGSSEMISSKKINENNLSTPLVPSKIQRKAL